MTEILGFIAGWIVFSIAFKLCRRFVPERLAVRFRPWGTFVGGVLVIAMSVVLVVVTRGGDNDICDDCHGSWLALLVWTLALGNAFLGAVFLVMGARELRERGSDN